MVQPTTVQSIQLTTGSGLWPVHLAALEAEAVEAMDAAWRDRGMKTRMEFLRRALGHYLTHIGAADAAAKFGTIDQA